MNDETNWGEEQKNPGQQPPRYQHYQFHEESRTALTAPDPSDHKKNRNSFQKKAETTSEKQPEPKKQNWFSKLFK